MSCHRVLRLSVLSSVGSWIQWNYLNVCAVLPPFLLWSVVMTYCGWLGKGAGATSGAVHSAHVEWNIVNYYGSEIVQFQCVPSSSVDYILSEGKDKPAADVWATWIDNSIPLLTSDVLGLSLSPSLNICRQMALGWDRIGDICPDETGRRAISGRCNGRRDVPWQTQLSLPRSRYANSCWTGGREF